MVYQHRPNLTVHFIFSAREKGKNPVKWQSLRKMVVRKQSRLAKLQITPHLNQSMKFPPPPTDGTSSSENESTDQWTPKHVTLPNIGAKNCFSSNDLDQSLDSWNSEGASKTVNYSEV